MVNYNNIGYYLTLFNSMNGCCQGNCPGNACIPPVPPPPLVPRCYSPGCGPGCGPRICGPGLPPYGGGCSPFCSPSPCRRPCPIGNTNPGCQNHCGFQLTLYGDCSNQNNY